MVIAGKPGPCVETLLFAGFYVFLYEFCIFPIVLFTRKTHTNILTTKPVKQYLQVIQVLKKPLQAMLVHLLY